MKQIRKEELNNITLDVEFLLISVVQAMALGALATIVGGIGMNKVDVLPYVITAFLIVLIFWSQAIIHAISFIKWPLDLGHSFLYFLAGFTEVLLFSQIEHPLQWFIYAVGMFIISGILYFYDLHIMQKEQGEFMKGKQKQLLFAHMINRQKFELYFLLPAAMLYNIVCIFLMNKYKELFLDYHYHVVLGSIQAIVTLGLLFNSIFSFKKRVELINRAE